MAFISMNAAFFLQLIRQIIYQSISGKVSSQRKTDFTKNLKKGSGQPQSKALDKCAKKAKNDKVVVHL